MLLLAFTLPLHAADFYVSPTGDDARDGTTPERAVKTPKRGAALVANNSSDRLLFQRGGVWAMGFWEWSKSGAAEDAPIVIGAYGDGPRPVFSPTTYHGFFHTGSVILSNVRLEGLAFDGLDLPRAGMNFTGIQVHNGRNITVYDCLIRGWANNLIFQQCKGIRVSACVVELAHAQDRHSQGLYAHATDDLTITGCTFDHNGHRAGVVTKEPEKNHNVYIQSTCGPAVVTGNAFLRAAATGVQARSGGVVEDNLFLSNPIALTFGLVYGNPPKAGGVSGTIARNRVLEPGDIGAAKRRIGIQVANVNDQGVVIDGNHVQQGANLPGASGLHLLIGNGIGVRRVTIRNNSFWTDVGISFNSDMREALVDAPTVGVVEIAGNSFSCPERPYSFWEAAPGYDFDPSKFTYSGNRHVSPIGATFTRLWGDRRRLVLDEAAWRLLTNGDTSVLEGAP